MGWIPRDSASWGPLHPWALGPSRGNTSALPSPAPLTPCAEPTAQVCRPSPAWRCPPVWCTEPQGTDWSPHRDKSLRFVCSRDEQLTGPDSTWEPVSGTGLRRGSEPHEEHRAGLEPSPWAGGPRGRTQHPAPGSQDPSRHTHQAAPDTQGSEHSNRPPGPSQAAPPGPRASPQRGWRFLPSCALSRQGSLLCLSNLPNLLVSDS